MSLVGQWVSEAKSKMSDDCPLRIHEYHGSNRVRDATKLAEFDLVVTTFETLASDWSGLTGGKGSRKKKGIVDASAAAAVTKENDAPKNTPCHKVNWHRVVLDESHKIKGKSGMTRAVNALASKRRWCVTGTPMNNGFEGTYTYTSTFHLHSTPLIFPYASKIRYHITLSHNIPTTTALPFRR